MRFHGHVLFLGPWLSGRPAGFAEPWLSKTFFTLRFSLPSANLAWHLIKRSTVAPHIHLPSVASASDCRAIVYMQMHSWRHCKPHSFLQLNNCSNPGPQSALGGRPHWTHPQIWLYDFMCILDVLGWLFLHQEITYYVTDVVWRYLLNLADPYPVFMRDSEQQPYFSGCPRS